MGGTWQTQNKVRPGVYVNTYTTSLNTTAQPDRGVVSLPLTLNWGKEKEMIEIDAGDINNIFDVLGYNITDPSLILIKEALKKAKTLLLYRLNQGTKAKITVGTTLTIEALYSGTRGNDISIVVEADVDNPGTFFVKTLLDNITVDEQTGENVEDLEANNFVVFSGTGALEATAGTKLQNGANGEVTSQDYSDYLVEVEKRAKGINTIGYVGTDSVTKELFKVFVERLREDEGLKIQAVLENYTTADYEGIISIKNGVVLADTTILTAEKCVAYVAGATAGANVNQSLTYSTYDGAIDVDTVLTGREIEDELKKGNIVFVRDGNKVKVEQDINTLTTFTAEKNEVFRKNRVLRVLDGFNKDVKRIYNDFFIGKVNNDVDGRSSLKNQIAKLGKEYEAIGAIQNFSPDDVIVEAGVEKDAVVITAGIQPTDSIEKIYINVEVV